jgi:hypothetical protein
MWPERITWRVACALKFSPAGAMAKQAWSVTNRQGDRTRIAHSGRERNREMEHPGRWMRPGLHLIFAT